MAKICHKWLWKLESGGSGGGGMGQVHQAREKKKGSTGWSFLKLTLFLGIFFSDGHS